MRKSTSDSPPPRVSFLFWYQFTNENNNNNNNMLEYREGSLVPFDKYQTASDERFFFFFLF
jgi:hypothetical protein